MNLKISILVSVIALIFHNKVASQGYSVSSPDLHLKISIDFSKETCFNITFKGQDVVEKICVDLLNKHILVELFPISPTI